EVGLRFRAVEGDEREGAVLLYAGDRGAAAPVGGAGGAGLEELAGVVEPDLRLGVRADAGVDEGLLVAPFAPAVAGGGAEGPGAGLAVGERREAVLALAEGPFLLGVG